MTVGEIARLCHELNRAYCESLGDTSQVPWENAPRWVWESAIAGVARAQAEGSGWSAELQHQAWRAAKLADGWVQGAVKDPVHKRHPNLIAWTELPEAERRKDVLFLAVVRACMEPV